MRQKHGVEVIDEDEWFRRVGEHFMMHDACDFWRGFGEVWPMLLAYAPIAALWGAVAAGQGFSPLEAVLVSGIVYSGAAQFVAVDLVKAATPLSLLVFTIATVGLRHVLMSASISRHITHFPKLRASILMFWLTDEAWAILERRALHEKLTPAYFLGAPCRSGRTGSCSRGSVRWSATGWGMVRRSVSTSPLPPCSLPCSPGSGRVRARAPFLQRVRGRLCRQASCSGCVVHPDRRHSPAWRCRWRCTASARQHEH
jgi:hypothetical protein